MKYVKIDKDFWETFNNYLNMRQTANYAFKKTIEEKSLVYTPMETGKVNSDLYDNEKSSLAGAVRKVGVMYKLR
jgi:hypothetical protein